MSSTKPRHGCWRMGGLELFRIHPDLDVASIDLLRSRGLRVVQLGRWRLSYAPRDHWSRNL